MALIPASLRETALPGSFALRDDEGVHGPGAERFVADVVADGGPRLMEAATGRIRFERVDVLAGAEEVPEPSGVSPYGPTAPDERHLVRIDEDGVVVQATTAEALHRGATSLRQLLRMEQPLGSREILDGPRFAWRGLSLDVVRCFFTPDEVRQVVDLLDLYKGNVLHLHLSDNEAWRLEIDGHPEVTEGGESWSQAELSELIAYAAERFITVIPEVDLPGHAAALLAVHPDWGVTAGEGIGRVAYLDPRSQPVGRFVYDDVDQLAGLTQGAFLHVGGDEAFGMPDELYADFVSRTLLYVESYGLKAVGWQEILRANVGPADVAQFWIDLPPGLLDMVDVPDELAGIVEFFTKADGDLDRALAADAKVLLSKTGVAYFDQPHGEPSSDPSQEGDRTRLGLQFYPSKTLEQLYDWDPATVLDGVAEDRLAGVEAAMWCETIEDVTDLQTMITTRVPGFLERAWSQRGTGEWSEYRTRLAAQAPVWRARGWSYHAASTVDWV